MNRITCWSVVIVLGLLLVVLPPGPLAADDAYEQGHAALDRQEWERAEALFREAAASGGSRADDALYWRAYALGKLSRVEQALRVLDELRRAHPDSAWSDDAAALRDELRGPAAADDDDAELRSMALLALIQADAERALPHVERFLDSDRSTSDKEQALFMLLQSGHPRATRTVVDLARNPQSEPELRAAAVRSLGVAGGASSRELLAEVYRSSTDTVVKRAVLDAYMVAGLANELLATARSETNPELESHAIQMLGAMGATPALERLFEQKSSSTARRALLHALMVAGHAAPVVRAARDGSDPGLRDEAIQLLGVMGGSDELWKIYDEERSVEVKERILQAQAVGPGAGRLVSIARGDAEPRLRAAAINGLGIAGIVSPAALTEIYRQEKTFEIKRAVLQALFTRGDVETLIEISRKESDPRLKREAVQFLAVSGSEEAIHYMMELLDENEE
jgi:tetratricopeptide (TPR) repeat protein